VIAVSLLSSFETSDPRPNVAASNDIGPDGVGFEIDADAGVNANDADDAIAVNDEPEGAGIKDDDAED
jgi:hypothetical protein